MPILEVAIPCPLRRRFDYLPPAGAEPHQLQPGQRLLVPFGNRRVVGLLLAVKDDSSVDTARLKPALALLDEQPTLDAELLALGQWAARYYQHPIGDCLQQMLPARLRREKPPREEPPALWRLTEAGAATAPEALKRAPQQARLLALLQRQPLVGRAELRDLGVAPGIARALCDKGLATPAGDIWQANGADASAATGHAPTLNAEQQQAVTAVADSLGRFAPFLLEGVTGSGKTEVYLRLIEQCLARGQQALVLVPEIGLTPQTLQRFQRRFSEPVTALHSGLSEGERLRGWQRARDGEARIVIGTRSAIFTPFKALGLIIVDEEHDLSYKQQDGFRYSARDLAVKRAADNHCPVLLGSATPALESLHNAERGRYQLLRLQHRAGGAKPPSVSLLDTRERALQDGLSEQVLTHIDDTLAAGNQALVFLNRRGFSPVLQCHGCGWLADCRHCDARLTVHVGRRQLRCHHCDAVEPLPSLCPQCHNPQLEYRGPGTERLEMALQRRFPQYPVRRIDRDTTSTKHAMQTLVEDVREGRPCVLVGTQMLAKGHHFPDVTTVVILDIDGGLFSADYRGAERCGQLLVQVAGRAGRADKPGRVLVQTHCPEHPVLRSLVDHGYPAFARALLAERQLMQLPPFGHAALVRADASRLDSAEQFLAALKAALGPPTPVCQAIGPLPAPMTRKAGRYRAVLLLQTERRAALHAALQRLCDAGESRRATGGLRWSVDVDPVDMY